MWGGKQGFSTVEVSCVESSKPVGFFSSRILNDSLRGVDPRVLFSDSTSAVCLMDHVIDDYSHD